MADIWVVLEDRVAEKAEEVFEQFSSVVGVAVSLGDSFPQLFSLKLEILNLTHNPLNDSLHRIIRLKVALYQHFQYPSRNGSLTHCKHI